LSEPESQFIRVGKKADARLIAYQKRAQPHNSAPRPGIVWLCGLKSDMGSTKATALDAWCANEGRALLRFDYSGHGASEGNFEDGTISRWLEESLAIIRRHTRGPQILVGSSLGGYLALLAARALAEAGETQRLAGLVLIAPAVDLTEALIWRGASESAKRAIIEDGKWLRPSDYGGEAYPITRKLIEDGRRHLLLDTTIRTYCPTRILQGMRDPDVPFAHAMTLVEHIAADAATLTLIKDGDHRLSRPQDIDLLFAAIAGIG